MAPLLSDGRARCGDDGVGVLPELFLERGLEITAARGEDGSLLGVDICALVNKQEAEQDVLERMLGQQRGRELNIRVPVT